MDSPPSIDSTSLNSFLCPLADWITRQLRSLQSWILSAFADQATEISSWGISDGSIKPSWLKIGRLKINPGMDTVCRVDIDRWYDPLKNAQKPSGERFMLSGRDLGQINGLNSGRQPTSKPGCFWSGYYCTIDRLYRHLLYCHE